MHVDVVVALTGHAAPAEHLGVPEVPGSTLITPGTFVPRAAHTYQLVRISQLVTAVSKLAPAARPFWAHTGATVTTRTQFWVSMVPVQTPVTVVSGGEVSAALARSGLRVAVVAVAVTLARTAVREAPETRQTMAALPTRGPRHALALTGRLVAKGAD